MHTDPMVWIPTLVYDSAKFVHKGYSLENLAEWMNVSKQQISRIEHGKCRISVVQLFQLARGLMCLSVGS